MSRIKKEEKNKIIFVFMKQRISWKINKKCNENSLFSYSRLSFFFQKEGILSINLIIDTREKK